MWKVLVPILVTDLVNPVLLAAVIYALGTLRPYANALALVLGHTLAYMGAGVLLALSFERLREFIDNPGPVAYGVGLAIGTVLLVLGYLATRPAEDRGRRDLAEERATKPLAAFGFGIVLNLIGIPFAVPYFAALNEILKQDFGWAGGLTTLSIYNLLYAAPFLGVVVVRAIFSRRADPLLDTLNRWVDRIGAVVLPALLLLLGAAMVLDAVLFFVRGKGLV